MSLYITADYHVGHENIIKYCDRPFKSLEEHDRHIITAHNTRIGEKDHFIHNGDFCFRNSPGGKKGEGTTKKSGFYISQLNGNGTFILGNHDSNNTLKTYIKSIVLSWGKGEYFVTHRPENANKHFPINFVGHVHNQYKFYRKRIDERFVDLVNVGIDVWGFMPRRIEEILKEYHRWTKSKEYHQAVKDQKELKYLKS